MLPRTLAALAITVAGCRASDQPPSFVFMMAVRRANLIPLRNVCPGHSQWLVDSPN